MLSTWVLSPTHKTVHACSIFLHKKLETGCHLSPLRIVWRACFLSNEKAPIHLLFLFAVVTMPLLDYCNLQFQEFPLNSCPSALSLKCHNNYLTTAHPLWLFEKCIWWIRSTSDPNPTPPPLLWQYSVFQKSGFCTANMKQDRICQLTWMNIQRPLVTILFEVTVMQCQWYCLCEVDVWQNMITSHYHSII